MGLPPIISAVNSGQDYFHISLPPLRCAATVSKAEREGVLLVLGYR